MTTETMALVAMIAGHLAAISRLFNVLRPLYGWLPAKAQPVVIALVAGLPPLAEALLVAQSVESVALAVASGVTAFFMAVKGAPPSGGDGKPVGAVERIRFERADEPFPPDEPAEMRGGWRHPAWRLGFGFALLASLCLVGCGPSAWEAQRTAANAVGHVANDTAKPALVAAYRATGLIVVRSQPDEAAGLAAFELHRVRWQPVWRAWESFAAAQDAWQKQIDAKGDPLPAAIAARESYCKLRPLAAEWSVELPDFPLSPCPGAP